MRKNRLKAGNTPAEHRDFIEEPDVLAGEEEIRRQCGRSPSHIGSLPNPRNQKRHYDDTPSLRSRARGAAHQENPGYIPPFRGRSHPRSLGPVALPFACCQVHRSTRGTPLEMVLRRRCPRTGTAGPQSDWFGQEPGHETRLTWGTLQRRTRTPVCVLDEATCDSRVPPRAGAKPQDRHPSREVEETLDSAMEAGRTDDPNRVGRNASRAQETPTQRGQKTGCASLDRAVLAPEPPDFDPF